jgi:hypothetical protein
LRFYKVECQLGAGKNCASAKDMHYVSGSAAANFELRKSISASAKTLHYISGSAAVHFLLLEPEHGDR